MRFSVIGIILSALHVAFLAETWARPAESVYQLRQWPEISDRRLSGVGRMIRHADRHEWLYGESAHFIGYATSLKELDALLAEAEFARAAAVRFLGLEPPTIQAHLFLISNDETWKKLIRDRGPEKEALAMHYRNEIYLRAGPSTNGRPDRVSHEIVHLLLRQACRDGLPLWLDEGLACFVGWHVAKEYGSTRNVVLSRHLPALSSSQVLPVEKLTSLREYPQDGDALPAYYRQVEELVVVLGQAIGNEQLGVFARAVCARSGAWRKVLMNQYGMGDVELDKLASAYRARCGESRKEP
jgi:hypothetical protein